jgi:hypothetical protein
MKTGSLLPEKFKAPTFGEEDNDETLCFKKE